MRVEVPEALEDRIEEAYEEAGYSTKSEFVRDGIRHRLERFRETARDEQLIHWLNSEDLIEVLESSYYPVGEVGDSGIEVDEEGNFTIFVKAFGVEIWMFRDYEWDSVKITATQNLPIDLLATSTDSPAKERHWRNHIVHLLLLSPGYLLFLNEDDELVDGIEQARSIRIEYRLYPDSLSREKLIKYVLDISHTVRFITQINELYRDSLQNAR